WARELRVRAVRTAAGVFWLRLELPDGTGEQWRDLPLAATHPRFVEAVLNHPRSGSRLVVAEKLKGPALFPANPSAGAAGVRTLTATLRGGADGLATMTTRHLIGDEGARQ